MRRIVVANQKGGVGKTTTAVNVAHGLALAGARVLLVDLDSQGSASLALGLDPAPASYRLLVNGEPLEAVVVTARERLDLLASDDSLADVRDWLAVRSTRSSRKAIRALSDALGNMEARYDFVVVDAGPGLDVITLNALMFAHEILIPVSADYLSAAGTRQHIEALEGLREAGGRAEVRYVVPTFVDRRLKRTREILAMLEQAFGDRVTEPIRSNTRLAEAPHAGKTIFEYDLKALGAADYEQLVRRIWNE